jgi:tetratricopeptide (TPR) repeat protein
MRTPGTETLDLNRLPVSLRSRLAGAAQERMLANRGMVILLLGLACVGGIFAQESKPTVRHHRVAEDPAAAAVFRAEAAMDRHDYAAAESALKQAVELDPENYRAWYDSGVVYNATNRTADAISAYRKSIAAFPKLFESNFNLGVLLGRAGDPEAAKYLRAATELTPTGNRDQSLASAWMTLGYLSKGSERLDAFRRAAELDPKNASPHLQAAAAAETMSDLATAEQEYKAAAEREPKSVDAVAGLANIYLQTKRLPEAETALRSYLALIPQDAKAHLQLGRVLAAQKKNEDAQSEFESASRFSPGDVAAKRELALLYVDNKQFAKAEPLFREVLQKDPRDAELHHRLAAVLIEQHKFEEAQKELLLAVNLKPDFGIAYGDLAFAASENKNYPLALKALDARAKLLSDTPLTLFLRATSYDHLGARREASASYHQFLAAANGQFPDQEWQARHRLIAIEPKK